MRLLPPEVLEDTAECLRVLGHPARLRMVEILLQRVLSVQEVAELCQLPPHQACEHLRLLKSHGLLESQRQGRSVHYRVVDPRLPKFLECIRAACGFPSAEQAPLDSHN